MTNFIQVSDDVVINFDHVIAIYRKENTLQFHTTRGKLVVHYESSKHALAVWHMLGSKFREHWVME